MAQAVHKISKKQHYYSNKLLKQKVARAMTHEGCYKRSAELLQKLPAQFATQVAWNRKISTITPQFNNNKLGE